MHPKSIFRAPAIAGALFALALLLPAATKASETSTPSTPTATVNSPQPSPGATTCPKPLPMQGQHIFQDLKGVILDLEFAPRFLEAQACHGDDETCFRYQSLARLPAYRARLNEEYEHYPKALHPDHVAAAFKQAIEKQLRVVKPDQCHPAAISVVSFLPPENQPSASVTIGKASFDDVNLPNTLTIRVRVDIDYALDPHIAILSVSLFRPEGVPTSTFLNTQPYMQLIPLNQTEDQIDKQFKDFVWHAEVKFTAGGKLTPPQY